jgi:hypothetical protein
MGKRIPERAINWGASILFMGFGVWGLYETLPPQTWSPGVAVAGMLLLAASAFLVHRLGARRGSQTLQEIAACDLPEAPAPAPGARAKA